MSYWDLYCSLPLLAKGLNKSTTFTSPLGICEDPNFWDPDPNPIPRSFVSFQLRQYSVQLLNYVCIGRCLTEFLLRFTLAHANWRAIANYYLLAKLNSFCRSSSRKTSKSLIPNRTGHRQNFQRAVVIENAFFCHWMLTLYC